MESTKNLIFAILSLIVIIFIGTLGYILIQKWGFLDSLYMTVITIATVGYGEVSKLSVPGKIFTIGLIAVGVGIVAYIVGSLSKMMVEGEMMQILGRRKLENQGYLPY